MPRILVIDDDPDIRNVLSLLLKAAGHEVILASDGAEGLRQLGLAPTDVVLTDLYMPNQEGIETIRNIRLKFPTVGIIAMSGETGADTMLSVARRMGAAAILEKPFFPNQLLIALDNALGLEEIV
jgi:CheY-like chemotaxis protein